MYLFSASSQKEPKLLPMPSEDEQLEVFQKHVGGYIELVPCSEDCAFVAYFDEEGMLKKLAPNYLSWGVLNKLGFSALPGVSFHFGNVLLMSADEQPLTEAQQKQVQDAVKAYKKEKGE